MESLIGLIGCAIFYLSWVYQSYKTKKNKTPTFDSPFFIIRIVASLLLIIEAIRIKSLIFLLMYIGTIFMMLYNLWKLKSDKRTN